MAKWRHEFEFEFRTRSLSSPAAAFAGALFLQLTAYLGAGAVKWAGQEGHRQRHKQQQRAAKQIN